MLKATGITGKYLEYCGRPLVRQENEIFYGDMSDKFYLYMMILSTQKNDKLNIEVPNRIMVQILPTDGSNSVAKQKTVDGLAAAFDLGMAWLERANRA